MEHQADDLQTHFVTLIKFFLLFNTKSYHFRMPLDPDTNGSVLMYPDQNTTKKTCIDPSKLLSNFPFFGEGGQICCIWIQNLYSKTSWTVRKNLIIENLRIECNQTRPCLLFLVALLFALNYTFLLISILISP